jgi:hypothetical protein
MLEEWPPFRWKAQAKPPDVSGGFSLNRVESDCCCNQAYTQSTVNRTLKQMWVRTACAYSEGEVGCFRSSKGFSQATPTCGASPRLILLPFGGIPNSPGFEENPSGCAVRFESD